MKKLLLGLLCLGMLVGCNNKEPNYQNDFKDITITMNEIGGIVSNYEGLGIELEYINKTLGSEVYANYKKNFCEVKLIFDKYNQQFVGITITDNSSSDKFSDDYYDILEATLKLVIYDMDSSTQNKIMSYFNSNETTIKNFDGYIVKRESNNLTIKNVTDDSLKESIADKNDNTNSQNNNSTNKDNDSESLIEQYGKDKIQDYCKEIINSTLKSPSSAEYPGTFLDPDKDWEYSESESIITVKSYVDSQNSFGAIVRSKFIIKMKITNGIGECTYLKIDDKVLKK